VKFVCKNGPIDKANAFDAAKVKQDTARFQLSDAFKELGVVKIPSAL